MFWLYFSLGMRNYLNFSIPGILTCSSSLLSSTEYLSAYPHCTQQADVVTKQQSKDEEVTSGLLLMQLLHLVLHLCQLGEGP